MIQLEEKKFYTLLKFFFSDFFCDYLEEYVTQTYADGKEIYKKLITKYEQELLEYQNKEKRFEDIYGNTDFF